MNTAKGSRATAEHDGGASRGGRARQPLRDTRLRIMGASRHAQRDEAMGS